MIFKINLLLIFIPIQNYIISYYSYIFIKKFINLLRLSYTL